MRRVTRSAAFVTAAALLALSSGAFAQTATQADYDQCNRQAQATLGASTSVSGTGASGTLSSGGSTMTSPGSSDANRQPNASGRISGTAGSPGTNTGAISSAPAAGGAQSGASASVSAPSASPASGTSAAGASGSGSDAQLKGLSASGSGNAAYETAYRDCMKRRGF